MPTISVPTNKLVIPLDGFATVNFGSASGNIGASNGGLAWYYIPTETFTLTTIIFQFTISTTPSPATFDVGIQGANATTGLPDGTFTTSGVWTAPAAGSGWAAITVTSLSLTKGTPIYVVIRNAVSGFSGSVSIASNCSNKTVDKLIGTHTRTSGVWSGPSTRPGGSFYLYSGTKYYGRSTYTLSGSEIAQVAPNEVGTTIQFPANGPDLILKRAVFNVTTVVVGTVFALNVRDAAGTLLGQSTLDGDFVTTTSFPTFTFPSPITLTAGTKYYIMLAQVSGTTPLMRTCVNYNAQSMTDIRNGVIANKVAYNGTTYTETTGSTCQGFLEFETIQYNQTGGTPTYSLPAGFNQLDF
jgi:hypothetical protein